jgi:WD40 repeat protein
MHYAIWSPDGRYVAAMGDGAVSLLDLRQRQWTPLTSSPPTDWAWSHDGKYLYVDRGEAGIFRIRIPGGKEERVANAKEIHRAVGGFGT